MEGTSVTEISVKMVKLYRYLHSILGSAYRGVGVYIYIIFVHMGSFPSEWRSSDNSFRFIAPENRRSNRSYTLVCGPGSERAGIDQFRRGSL